MSEEPFAEPERQVSDDNGMINIRTDPASKAAFRKKAARKGMDMSKAGREALRDWMKKP